MEGKIKELRAQLERNMAVRKQLLNGRHSRDLQGEEKAKFNRLVSQAESLRVEMVSLQEVVRVGEAIEMYLKRGYSRAEAECAVRNDEIEAAKASGLLYYTTVRVA